MYFVNENMRYSLQSSFGIAAELLQENSSCTEVYTSKRWGNFGIESHMVSNSFSELFIPFCCHSLGHRSRGYSARLRTNNIADRPLTLFNRILKQYLRHLGYEKEN